MNTQAVISILDNPQFKGVIFDFDGTLFNLDVDWEKLKKTLEVFTYKNYNLKLTFTPYIESINMLKKQNKKAYDEAIQIVEEHELIGLEKGIANTMLIDYIRNTKHKKLAAYTMNTTNIFDMFIDRHNLHNKFDFIATQQTCIAPKPSAEDLLHIVQKWRYNNTDVLYIGDSDYDRKSGKMAGIQTEIITM